MKTIPQVFLFMLLLLVVPVGASASQMEFYGGLTYNTGDPAEINELLKDLNEEVIPKEELESNEEALPSFIYGIKLAGNLDYIKSTPKELAEIKGGYGGFLGGRCWLRPEIAVGAEIEHFRFGSEGGIDGLLEVSELTISQSGEGGFAYEVGDLSLDGALDFSVTGGVTGCALGVALKALPEVAIFGSVGYYYLNGTLEQRLWADYGGDEEISSSVKVDFAKSSPGCKIGGSFSYPINKDLCVIGRVSRRSIVFTEVDQTPTAELKGVKKFLMSKADLDEEQAAEQEGKLKASFEKVDSSDINLPWEEFDPSGYEIALGVAYQF